jgi:hypothetical protein
MPSASAQQLPVLSIDIDGRTEQITVSQLQPDGNCAVGTFASVAEAWAAIDQLDAHAALSEASAGRSRLWSWLLSALQPPVDRPVSSAG